jgi:hypothetical protein
MEQEYRIIVSERSLSSPMDGEGCQRSVDADGPTSTEKKEGQRLAEVAGGPRIQEP